MLKHRVLPLSPNLTINHIASKTFRASRFISLSISRYRAKALLPSLCPLIEATMLGSFTRLYRLPQNVLRAIWLLAHSLIGIRTSRLVVGSSTVTTRLIPASRKTSLMASLYFCSEMNSDLSTNLYTIHITPPEGTQTCKIK